LNRHGPALTATTVGQCANVKQGNSAEAIASDDPEEIANPVVRAPSASLSFAEWTVGIRADGFFIVGITETGHARPLKCAFEYADAVAILPVTAFEP
jgi:hypothetical protein